MINYQQIQTLKGLQNRGLKIAEIIICLLKLYLKNVNSLPFLVFNMGISNIEDINQKKGDLLSNNNQGIIIFKSTQYYVIY